MPKQKNNKPKINEEPQNKITVFDYDEKKYEEKTVKTIHECVRFKDTSTVTWINIDNVPPVEFLSEMGLGFDLHPVILEDILNTKQRPKVEITDDYVYVILKMLYQDETDKKIICEQVSIIIAKKFVISLQQGIEGDVFQKIRDHIRKPKTRTRQSGTDYLGYRLMDEIVDNYFRILENFGEKIENLEDELITNPTPKTLKTLHNLKREILTLRKYAWPMREVVNILERGDSPLIKKHTSIYLRDLYEHTVQVIDAIETYREVLSSMLDVYLSSISNKMNSIMKVLAIITTIFMPMTFLTGLYGMNFKYMPGLGSLWGFPILAGAMLLIFLFMLVFFKGKKWI